MALVYSAICSLDGYVADSDGRFEWAAPDEELHAAVNERQRDIATYLYGRRMYQVMSVWESWDTADEPAVVRDFAALWRQADKVVFSRTLPEVPTTRTRLERSFDPEVVRRLVAQADGDVSVGGPGLAAEAWRAGLVDEVELYLVPAIVGGGTRALPDEVRADLELVDAHPFAGGAVGVRYRVRRST